MIKVFFIVLFFTSCSTIHYKSENKIPVFLSTQKDCQKLVQIKGKKHFFLWGLYPKYHEVYLDRLAKQFNYKKIAKIIIEEGKTWDDLLWSFLSVGLYVPNSYSISGLVPLEEKENEY